jgi:hypothetical protein
MKKILLTALLVSAMALAQTFPSPTFSSITLQTPLAASSGGTGASTTSGSGFTCNASITVSTSSFSSSMTTFFNALPTTLPATSGVLWDNGGILSKS